MKIGFCAIMTVAMLWSGVRWRKAAVRGALHAGVLSGMLGRKPLQLY
jgi:succinoglycan biosynthesis protein ExoM